MKKTTTVVSPEKILTCQHCKSQTNKPSFCHRLGKYVARKANPCSEFAPKHKEN